jgi:uncharacterized protein YecE (DUF72 family)
MESNRFLQYYSQVFDYVEIDSTFYKVPRRQIIIKWVSSSPPDFKFTAKFPQVVTHDTRLGGGLDVLDKFLEMMKPLERKLLCLLIQLPASLTRDEGLPKLERLIPLLWKKYRYAIDVRHKSWFDKEVYKLLSRHGICLAWSQLDSLRTPPELTTDFFYLRFMGDRNVEKDSGKIQNDRLEEIRSWSGPAKQASRKVKFGIVSAHDHYAGFGPATANAFKKIVGLPERVWK